MHSKTWRILWLMGLAVALACSGSDPDDPGGGPDAGSEEHRPGLGHSDKPPEGQAFSLPTGVELAGPIKGYSEFEEEKCFPQEEPKGAGDMVRICLPLRNTTNTTSNPLPISITFPAGFTVISEDLDTQNGILVKQQTVVVQPGRTIYLPLYMFCLNGNRDSSSTDDTFRLGPVVQYADFREFFDLLEDKTLEQSGQGELQAAVWRLSEGKALTPADRTLISNL
ncbi:hypothetical protein ACLESO_54505 [Pyxidicoccus sp. 3LG]